MQGRKEGGWDLERVDGAGGGKTTDSEISEKQEEEINLWGGNVARRQMRSTE